MVNLVQQVQLRWGILKTTKRILIPIIDLCLGLMILPFFLLGFIYKRIGSDKLKLSGRMIKNSEVLTPDDYFDALQRNVQNQKISEIGSEWELMSQGSSAFSGGTINPISLPDAIMQVAPQGRAFTSTILGFGSFANRFAETVVSDFESDLDWFDIRTSGTKLELSSRKILIQPYSSQFFQSKILDSDIICIDLTKMLARDRQFPEFIVSILPKIRKGTHIFIAGLGVFDHDMDLWKLNYLSGYSALDLVCSAAANAPGVRLIFNGLVPTIEENSGFVILEIL